MISCFTEYILALLVHHDPQMTKPHIVLLPGAWHYPSCYSLIIPKLEAAGYTVHTTQLPSVTDRNPPKDLSADIAIVQSVLEKAIGSGNDVIVCPHSWAGMVAGCALVGYGSKERKARGEKGGVVRCGYMCAYMVSQGETLAEVNHGQPSTWWSPKVSYL